jgi:ribosomal protein S18 acetylase RimI-like enzyme
MIVRAARWTEDAAAIAALDTSFTTDRVYRIVREPLGFTLAELMVDPPVTKHYPILDVDPAGTAFVAEVDGEIAGFAQVEPPAWNGCAVVSHLYVSSSRRGQGFGAALVDALAEHARAAGARCLWAETQNVNHPAVQFYLAAGFRLCGLDESFYDPAEHPGEGALFFARELI